MAERKLSDRAISEMDTKYYSPYRLSSENRRNGKNRRKAINGYVDPMFEKRSGKDRRRR